MVLETPNRCSNQRVLPSAITLLAQLNTQVSMRGVALILLLTRLEVLRFEAHRKAAREVRHVGGQLVDHHLMQYTQK